MSLTGIPRRTYHRWMANARRTGRAKGSWPAPVVDPAEAVVAKYAADWPAWGQPPPGGRGDRHVFNHVRPHEALGFHRPIDVHRDPPLKPQPKIENAQPSATES